MACGLTIVIVTLKGGHLKEPYAIQLYEVLIVSLTHTCALAHTAHTHTHTHTHDLRKKDTYKLY